MKSFPKNILLMIAASGLAISGMGSSCPGTNSKAQFDDSALSSIAPTTNSTTFTRSWQTPMFFDLGAANPGVAASDFPSNVQLATGINSAFPMAVFNDGPASFYGIFNASNKVVSSGVPTNVFAYATHLNDISTTWVKDMSAFTLLLDTNSPAAVFPFTGAVTEHPVTTVDSQGNIVAVLASKVGTAPNHMRPLAFRHIAGNNAWNVGQDLSNAAVVTNMANTLAAGSDSANNQVVVWAQGVLGTESIFYNEYRPNLGWRFPSGSVPNFDLNVFVPATLGTVGIGTKVIDQGADMGFDSFGNGYIVFVATVSGSPAVIAERWRSDIPSPICVGCPGPAVSDTSVQVSTTPAAPGVLLGFPRIVVSPDGSARVFWWQNFNAGTQIAELWTSTAPATSLGATPGAAWGAAAPVRLDTQGVGAGAYMQDGGPVPATYSPIVAHDGAQGAVAYVKSDGVSRRLFVHTSANNWSTIGTADIGGPASDVHSASIAINLAGTVAVVYSANNPIDGREHVYGNVYSGGWQGAQLLDTGTATLATTPGLSTSPGLPFPIISLDETGVALVVFSMAENSFLAPRRAVAVVYR